MEKPIQFTIVSEVPFDSCGALRAINVENIGESAITAILQINKNTISVIADWVNNNRGEIKQQLHDKNKATVAVFFTPKYCDKIPLKAQDTDPAAMIRNDKKGILKPAKG